MVTKKVTKKVTKRKINKLKEVESLAKELLSLMGISVSPEVSEDKKNEAFLVLLKTEEEAGLLIGRHGQTIEALQAALGMLAKERLGEWVRVIVNVGDWREKQEEHLKTLASSAAERAKLTGEPQPLYNLTPAQRRVIHLALSEDPEVETESLGEDEERYLVVKKKG
ncbi:MAG: Single-stranded nucleic acid binding R3H domain protein [Candidatus Woesebacteria bacterium GW2011_GWA1_45_8]|uniref:Single-stranded nucleic acid binding R3H domain protein n=1 Tax=Candidatus Woesebacteria bacterium GW2011_GWA1_45_8 TaxID=1618559 RepID=A0A0G1MVS3_9BACT|nr:MAG: Single-stranded nucleic acid binding R3H domain protein [Candidatus Woesebacteria bacterium GW2011_GWA1_45_8]